MQTTHRILDNIQQLSQSLEHKGPAWAQKIRQEALTQFLKNGFPTLKDEEWKYTDISPLTKNTYHWATTSQASQTKELLNFLDKDSINIVFVNGVFSKELSNLKNVPAGLSIKTLEEVFKSDDVPTQNLLQYHESCYETAFTALSIALTQTGIVIDIKPKLIVEPMIHIVHLTEASNTTLMTSPRTLITAGVSSEAKFLETYISYSDESVYLSAPLTDIYVKENATLHYYKAQKESLKAYHVGQTRIWQERNSNFHNFILSAGSLITRNNVSLTLNGEGANSILNGLYCSINHQLVDNHTAVDHREPNCTSNQFYKGVLNDSSHAIFNGKIFVRPIAQKTNSYQLNKNLILGKNAHVDTKPQLEIFADDVKCTHGATIGQVSPEEIFYLQSRAIDQREAVRMLSRGFIDEILNRIEIPSVRAKFQILLEPAFAHL
jgi:Fe-S cluster assembly protein SufD